MIFLNSKKRGYTLLFSIVLSSIVLSLAAFIISVSRKQFILTAASRDSTVAIYAADSGIQCATEVFFGGTYSTTTTSFSMSCNNASNSVSFAPLYNSEEKTSMGFKTDGLTYKSNSLYIYFPDNGSCAVTTFTSGIGDASNLPRTVIESRGYNMGNSTGDDNCPEPNNPRAVERAIRLVYD